MQLMTRQRDPGRPGGFLTWPEVALHPRGSRNPERWALAHDGPRGEQDVAYA